ncbi:MAG: flagella basal body P-ring formation protein FlgA [Oligoflexia bacterium]|nr:flagella basal body P-ring formation protein FlgA [Oligoflexia bacterium]
MIKLFFTGIIGLYFFWAQLLCTYANNSGLVEEIEVVPKNDNEDNTHNRYRYKCSFVLPSQIYVDDFVRVEDLKKALRVQSNCPEEVLQGFIISLFSVGKGEVKSSYINEVFSKELHGYYIEMLPPQIVFYKLSDYLHEILNCPFEKNFAEVRYLAKDQYLLLTKGERLSVILDDLNKRNCTEISPGEGKVIVSVTGNRAGNMAGDTVGDNPIEKKIYSTFKIVIKTKVLKSVANISGFAKEKMGELFVEDYIDTIGPELYFQNKDKLKFYQLNKSVSKNYILKNSDLIALSLINSGESVKVIVEKNNLKMIGTGISKNNGKLGEIVQLYNPKSKKAFSGMVTDFNTVVVQ